MRADDAIDGEAARRLEAFHRCPSARTEPAVDWPRGEAAISQLALQHADRPRAFRLRHAGSLGEEPRRRACLAQRTARFVTDDPIDRQTARPLEAFHSRLRQGTVEAIDGAGREVELSQPELESADLV